MQYIIAIGSGCVLPIGIFWEEVGIEMVHPMWLTPTPLEHHQV